MLMTVTTYAQLPSAFGSEYDGITQKDELTRTYISPVKILWTSDSTGELVKNADVLFKMKETARGQSLY